MPWVTFDLNQFKGRAVTEDEYPEYFHLDTGDPEAGEEKPEERNDEK